jgi:hypothetical protein
MSGLIEWGICSAPHKACVLSLRDLHDWLGEIYRHSLDCGDLHMVAACDIPQVHGSPRIFADPSTSRRHFFPVLRLALYSIVTRDICTGRLSFAFADSSCYILEHPLFRDVSLQHNVQ